MRLVAVPLGLAVLSACSVPNPAYFATQGGTDSSSSATGATTTAGSAGPTTVEPGTTDAPPTSTSATSSPTTVTTSTTGPVDPSTSASMTATSTTLTTESTDTLTTVSTSTGGTDSTSLGGTDSTSTGGTDTMGFQPMLDMGVVAECALLAAPNLALSVQHVPAPASCTLPEFGPVFHGVYTGKTDADSLSFRQCKTLQECTAGNTDCLADQTVTINFTGPGTHVPVFDVGACVNIAYIGTGYENANTCQAKIIRLARTGPNIKPTSVYVGATIVPDTSLLPAPWPSILEFSVKPSLQAPCGDPNEQICGQGAGDYSLLGTFSNIQTEVPIKTEKSVKIPQYDAQNNKIGDIIGSLYNLRSWAHPIEECEFKWIWLADENKPG